MTRRNGRVRGDQASTGRKKFRFEKVIPRNDHQEEYLKSIDLNKITIGSGPAGSGKTFLAVYQALRHLQTRSANIDRIIITRPAVEAGEKLGFLPGDLEDKLNPYMRPIHDALVDILNVELAKQKIERGYIEIAPIAYMRGRTFNNSFILVDEAQNATLEQLKMILTRVGEGSKLVIAGDPSQSDINSKSGLARVENILKDVEGVGIVHFETQDIVRDEIVAKIVEAFKAHDGSF